MYVPPNATARQLPSVPLVKATAGNSPAAPPRGAVADSFASFDNPAATKSVLGLGQSACCQTVLGSGAADSQQSDDRGSDNDTVQSLSSRLMVGVLCPAGPAAAPGPDAQDGPSEGHLPPPAAKAEAVQVHVLSLLAVRVWHLIHAA